MSTPTPPTEKTFSNFNKAQGAAYAQIRPGYHPNLYQTILDQHTSTGGQLGTLLDVGCGPGTTALGLASHFTHVIGLDPSEGMISTARSSVASEPENSKFRFEISTAEDLGSHLSPPVEDSSVDLITASTAAHWFNMSLFWPRAARVLKPGGSVAIWTTSAVSLHPDTPNHAAVQASMDAIEERELKPFFEPGNLMTRNLYADLELPWTIDPPVPDFDKKAFYRKEYSPDLGNNEEFIASRGMTFGLDAMEKVLGTGSPVQRWREAHPDAVGTERDVIKMMRREIERLLHEAGVEKGKEVVKGSIRGILLIAKKKT